MALKKRKIAPGRFKLGTWVELSEEETRRLAVGEVPEAVRTRLVTVARETIGSLDLGPAAWARGDDERHADDGGDDGGPAQEDPKA